MPVAKKIKKTLPKKSSSDKLVFPAELVKAYQEKKLKKQKRRRAIWVSTSVAVLLLVVVLGISSAILFPKIPESKIVAGSTIKQAQIVAGQPVKWTMLVPKSQIKNGKYLAQLPKEAQNIKVKQASAEQAKIILSSKPQPRLSLAQRQQLAVVPVKNQRNALIKGFSSSFASISDAFKFMFADLGDAVENVIPVSEIIQNIGGQPADQTITPAVDATYVNIATPPTEVSTPVLTTINISPLTLDLTVGGSTQQLTAETLDQSGMPITADLIWASDNTAVATVNSSGVVAPVSAGTANIVATSKSATSTAPAVVTVLVADIKSTSAPAPKPSVTPAVTPTPDAPAGDFVAIQYETPAPEIVSEATDTGQQVTVSATNEDAQAPLVDVLASTKIPEIFKVGQEDKIKIKWETNGNQDVAFHAYDTDNNGKLDYVEWTVPHLSEQIFNIIFISKAFQLDTDQTILSDIYDTVKTQDGNYATITNNQYVRFTFEKTLTNKNDNTIYARATNYPLQTTNSSIQVFPVYTDADGNVTEGPQIASFSDISGAKIYKVLLTNLQTPTDQFDFKISGSIDFDFIVDPTCPNGWAGSGTEGDACQVTECGTIDISGYYQLASNITSDGTCLQVDANNVIIDGNNKTLTFNTGDNDGSVGIYMSNLVSGLTVKNFDNGSGVGIFEAGSGSSADVSPILAESCLSNSFIQNNIINVSGQTFSFGSSGIQLGIGSNCTSSNNIISGNTITSGQANGIDFEDASSGNTISGNTISAPFGDGINFNASSANDIVSGNTISANEYGVSFTRPFTGNPFAGTFNTISHSWGSGASVFVDSGAYFLKLGDGCYQNSDCESNSCNNNICAAQTYHWVGGDASSPYTGNSWDNPANWQGNVVPPIGANIEIPMPISSHPPVIPAGFSNDDNSGVVYGNVFINIGTVLYNDTIINGGTFSGPITNDATGIINAGTFTGTIYNYGTIDFTGLTPPDMSGTTVTNAPGGTIICGAGNYWDGSACSTITAYHWVGSQSTDWATAGNWKEGSVPPSGANVVIGSDATSNAIISNGYSNDLNGGVTLVDVTITGSYNIVNYGTITDMTGTVTSSGTSLGIDNYGTIANISGDFIDSSNGTGIYNEVSGIITDISGSFTNSGNNGFGINNSGVITNISGTFTNTATDGNSIGIDNNGTITDITGSFVNSGRIGIAINDGAFINNISGSFANSSGFGIYNNSGGTISDITGTLTNSGSSSGIMNDGGTIIDISGGSSSHSLGGLTNSGGGYGINNNSGVITNITGTVTNSSSGFGFYNNNSTLTDISGTIDNTGGGVGIYNDYRSTILDISGAVTNSSSGYGIDTPGTILEISGSFTNSGTSIGIYIESGLGIIVDVSGTLSNTSSGLGVNNAGTIYGGIYPVSVKNEATGTIVGGTFSNAVNNYGTIDTTDPTYGPPNFLSATVTRHTGDTITCASGKNWNVNQCAPLATSITVTGASSATTVANGSTLQMSASVSPAGANQNVTWSRTNGTGTATINSSGLLTGTGVGTVTVTATAQDGSAVFGTKQITVTAVLLSNGANGCTNGVQCTSGFCTSDGYCTDQSIDSHCATDDDCEFGLACTNSVCANVVVGEAVVNGACGSSNGQDFSSSPASNLCTTGTATAVSGTGPWTWDCVSTNGGTTANCSATKTPVSTPAPTCGDATCNGTETCSTCSADCGACPTVSGSGVGGGGTITNTITATTQATSKAMVDSLNQAIRQLQKQISKISATTNKSAATKIYQNILNTFKALLKLLTAK